MKNGLRVIGTQDSETPKVELMITIDGGNLVSGPDLKKVGIARLTAGMMEEGTKNYTTEQISAELDKLGSSISFNAGRENTTIEVSCLVKNIDATMKLLEEKLLHPRFDPEDFKRVKKQTIEAIRTEKKSAEITAQRLFTNLMYGNTIFGSYTTEKNVKKLTLDDVKNYYQQNYSPSVAKLVVVGDITEKDIMPKLAFLEKWEAKPVKMPEFTGFAPIQQTQIYLVHKDNAPQSTFVIGNPALAYDPTGDFFKSNVMNFSLGGNFNSRLNLDLRETKGYTYGIRSYFQGSKYPGPYAISAGVRRSATDSSLRDVMKDVIDFRTGGLKDDELSFTKSSYLNSQALRYESPVQKANYLNNILEYNLPKDYNKQQEKVLNEISKAELNDLAKKYISPDKFVILVVGNKYMIKDKLEKLGYGKVKEVELE
jgi:zinc protease